MYPRNAATPPRMAIGAVVQISDGAVQTSGVSVTVRPEGGNAAAGDGTISYTEGVVHYVPTQAETNHVAFTVTAHKTGCIPATITVVTTASATAGQVVVGANNDKTGYSLSGTQTFNVTGNITGNLSGSVGSVTGSVGSVTAPVTAGTVNDKTGYSLTQTFPANFASLGINSSGHISRVVINDTTTANTDKVTAAEIRAAVGLASANLDTQLAGQILAGSSLSAGLTVNAANQVATARAITQSGFSAPAVDLISGSSAIDVTSIVSALIGVRLESGQHRIRTERLAASAAISVHGNGTLALDVGIMQGGISLSESNANLFIRAQRMDGFTFAGPSTVNMRVEAGHINGVVESINNSNIVIRNAIISSDVACYEGVIELHDCIIRGNVTQSGTGVIRVTAGTQIFGNRIGNINLLPSDATSIVEALNELLVDQIFKRRGQITGDLTLQPGDELGLTFVEDPINVFDQLPKLDEELYWQINLPGGQTAPVTILSTPPE
jgi:hypothetical protein